MITDNVEILTYFAKLIETELGIVYSAHNYFQLQNRLDQIAVVRKLPSLVELYEEAKRGMTADLRSQLMDIATNNETSFFRDVKIFRATENLVLAKRPSGPAADTMRIWSAASSSGQEALSIAMMLLEWNEKQSMKISFEITGSDISGRILKRASDACYSELEMGRGLPDALRAKYFDKVDENSWRARDVLREKMKFIRLNLKDRFQFDKKFDVIFCRNVLIYQSVEAKKEILARITSTLSDQGHLILGAGESLYGLSDSFDQMEAEGSVMYRKKASLSKVA